MEIVGWIYKCGTGSLFDNNRVFCTAAKQCIITIAYPVVGLLTNYALWIICIPCAAVKINKISDFTDLFENQRDELFR